MSQEKSLMFIRTEAYSEETVSDLHPPGDISPSRVYYVTGQCQYSMCFLWTI